MKKIKKKNNYLYGLDALRTLAIVGVTLFHIFPSTVKGGYLGVCLFFVITGFLLSVNSKKKFNIFEYFKKRIMRIYPSLLVVVFVTCGICFFFSNNTLSGMKQEVLSILGGYNNWWQIGQNSDYFTKSFNNSPFTHFWFLGIELQYYLIWPILFLLYRLFKKRRMSLILVGMSILSALCMIFGYKANIDVTPLYYGTHTRFFALLLGSAFGFLFVSKKRKYSSNYKAKQGLILAGEFLFTILMYFVLDGQSALLYRGGMFVMTLLFVHMVSIVTDINLPYGKMLEIPAFKWFSKYSFPIYLWQYPVIFFFTVFGWVNFPFYQIFEIILIVLLAVGLEKLLNFRQIRNRTLAIVLAVCTFLTMTFGVYGIARDDGRKQEAIEEMQKQLEENQKAQEEAMKKKQEQKDTTEEKEEKETTEPKKETTKERNARIMASYKTDYCEPTDAVMIGDSILLSCFKSIENLIPDCVINGAVSRQASQGIIVYEDIEEKGYVKQTVVICLGTNGDIQKSVCEELLNRIGDTKDIFWVNNYVPTRSWMVKNNEILNELEEEYDNLHLIDWVEICMEHPEYLGADGVHPNEEGREAYAQMIYDAITTTPHIILK
ncbi:MAG: acyltransferase family protein [Bacillota bacterium]|nr:acyltransferase family protein [Bacillota bacterium]